MHIHVLFVYHIHKLKKKSNIPYWGHIQVYWLQLVSSHPCRKRAVDYSLFKTWLRKISLPIILMQTKQQLAIKSGSMQCTSRKLHMLAFTISRRALRVTWRDQFQRATIKLLGCIMRHMQAIAYYPICRVVFAQLHCKRFCWNKRQGFSVARKVRICWSV